MLKPIEKERADAIVKNILAACRDISLLSLESYRWLHLRSGFIAHYCREGFIEEYQTNQNLRECILAYQHANIHCTRNANDVEYPYYRQQSGMYNQIVDQLNATEPAPRQRQRTDEFSLELSKEIEDEIHRLTLVTKRGTSTVYCDTNFLVSLQQNISLHLNATKP